MTRPRRLIHKIQRSGLNNRNVPFTMQPGDRILRFCPGDSKQKTVEQIGSRGEYMAVNFDVLTYSLESPKTTIVLI